jgi:hypothetical protein
LFSGDNGVDRLYPGVGTHSAVDAVKIYDYYKWTAFVLFFQGILSYVPHYFWKIWEGGKIKLLTHDMEPFQDDPDVLMDRINFMVLSITPRLGNFRYNWTMTKWSKIGRNRHCLAHFWWKSRLSPNLYVSLPHFDIPWPPVWEKMAKPLSQLLQKYFLVVVRPWKILNQWS